MSFFGFLFLQHLKCPRIDFQSCLQGRLVFVFIKKMKNFSLMRDAMLWMSQAKKPRPMSIKRVFWDNV